MPKEFLPLVNDLFAAYPEDRNFWSKTIDPSAISRIKQGEGLSEGALISIGVSIMVEKLDQIENRGQTDQELEDFGRRHAQNLLDELNKNSKLRRRLRDAQQKYLSSQKSVKTSIPEIAASFNPRANQKALYLRPESNDLVNISDEIGVLLADIEYSNYPANAENFQKLALEKGVRYGVAVTGPHDNCALADQIMVEAEMNARPCWSKSSIQLREQLQLEDLNEVPWATIDRGLINVDSSKGQILDIVTAISDPLLQFNWFVIHCLNGGPDLLGEAVRELILEFLTADLRNVKKQFLACGEKSLGYSRLISTE